jgi:hypothetical protein
MYKKRFSLLKISTYLALVLLFFACERVIETLEPVTYDYFPLEVGKYKIYQVDSTVYDEYTCTVQTTSYQVRELTGSVGTDGEGDVYYSVERHIRGDSTEPWVLQHIWSEKIEENQLQRVEENQRMVKMVFPVKENTHWDGIVYIRRDTLVPIRGGSIHMYKDWDDFVYGEIGNTFIDTSRTGPRIYTEALEVTQVDKTNNIERRLSKEVYAKDIGLVYKEMWILDTQCRPPGACSGVGDIGTCILTPWKQKAEKGFILVQALIDHNY